MQYLNGLGYFTLLDYKILRRELDLVLERLKFAMDYWDYNLPEGIEILDE